CRSGAGDGLRLYQLGGYKPHTRALPVGAGVGWVLQLPVPANVRTTTRAHIRPVPLDVGVRLAGVVGGEVLLATVRATPRLTGEHGQVRVVLDPGAEA